MILWFSDIMPDRSHQTLIGGEGASGIHSEAFWLEADSNVKPEMRESFGET
jgi:hypothetical protein